MQATVIQGPTKWTGRSGLSLERFQNTRGATWYEIISTVGSDRTIMARYIDRDMALEEYTGTGPYYPARCRLNADYRPVFVSFYGDAA